MNRKKYLKALTFSFDDGVTQDKRLISILNKYGLKATFNLNSGLLGMASSLTCEGVTVAHVKPDRSEIRDIYSGHEVAAHSLTHQILTKLGDDEVYHQVEDDRCALSELLGYDVVGMAYPGGGRIYDDRIVNILKNRTGIKYARTDEESYSFEPQTDLLRFQPTVYTHHHISDMFVMAEKFLKKDSDSPQLFFIYGHSYEFDIDNSWMQFEAFCEKISKREDLFYGTNKEVLLTDGLKKQISVIDQKTIPCTSKT